MKRIVNVDAEYKTMDIHKNLARFARRFPEAADYCYFDDDCSVEDIAKSLPITDKFYADGTVNNDWSYYLNIDFDCCGGIYIWFIGRA